MVDCSVVPLPADVTTGITISVSLVIAFVVENCLELCSASLLMRSLLSDKVTLKRLTISVGVNPVLISALMLGSCEVVGLIMFSPGNSCLVSP